MEVNAKATVRMWNDENGRSVLDAMRHLAGVGHTFLLSTSTTTAAATGRVSTIPCDGSSPGPYIPEPTSCRTIRGVC